MTFDKKHSVLTAAALGGFILFSAICGQAQENDMDPIKLRTPIRINPFDRGMTQIDPPAADRKPSDSQPATDQPVGTETQPKRSMVSSERTATGTIFRYSDGSTVELKPEYSTETLKNGTKIEKLPEGTTIVRWPDGRGIVRNPDGTGAEFRPDPREPSRSGDLTPVEGTIEVLPGGVVRQTLKDDGVVLDRHPNGTNRSRPDLVKPEAKTMDQPVKKSINVTPLNPSKPISLDKKPDAHKPLIPMVKPSISRQ